MPSTPSILFVTSLFLFLPQLGDLDGPQNQNPAEATHTTTASAPATVSWDPFLDTLQVRTLKFFLETTDSSTGLTPDRWPSSSPSSIAAVGFALTAYPIAVERKLITRQEAARRTLNTLRFFWKLPQHDQPQNVSGYRGFFYHFLKIPPACENGIASFQLSTPLY